MYLYLWNLHLCVFSILPQSSCQSVSVGLMLVCHLSDTHTCTHTHRKMQKVCCGEKSLRHTHRYLYEAYTHIQYIENTHTHTCIPITLKDAHRSSHPSSFTPYASMYLLRDGLSSALMEETPQKDRDILFYSVCQLRLIQSRRL